MLHFQFSTEYMDGMVHAICIVLTSTLHVHSLLHKVYSMYPANCCRLIERYSRRGTDDITTEGCLYSGLRYLKPVPIFNWAQISVFASLFGDKPVAISKLIAISDQLYDKVHKE